MARKRSPPVFTEKEFYLDEFRGRTLLLAVHHDGPAERLHELGDVARDLLLNDTRVLVLLGGSSARGRSALKALERALTAVPSSLQSALPFPQLRLSPSTAEAPVLAVEVGSNGEVAVGDQLLIQIWGIVRAMPFFLGVCPGCSPERLAIFAQEIGARLRVHKLVICDPGGGVRSAGATAPLSFMDEAVTGHLLQAGEAEWAGLGTRRPMLDAVRRGLLAGINSVNLCSLDGLARELFTYEGSGTLFTREDYCRVDRLALDDFHEVEKLLERGQREGYLKVRTADEVARILLSGYGATIGEHHLAGVCSLQTEQYSRMRAGEIVGLYTITRFKGEGVGVKLVDHMKEEGRRRGLAYLFACTTQERVGQFFVRQGFRPMPQNEVPPEKWACYDEARRKDVAVYRFDL